jgi:hypothetical protein
VAASVEEAGPARWDRELDELLLECIEVVDQAGHHVFDRKATFGIHHRQRLGSHPVTGGLECSYQVGEERPQLSVGRVEGQPPHPQSIRRPDLIWVLRPPRRQPLRQQGGLPEPGRGRHEDQPRHPRRIRLKSVDQPLAGDRRAVGTRSLVPSSGICPA